jgi:hypothetical protein
LAAIFAGGKKPTSCAAYRLAELAGKSAASAGSDMGIRPVGGEANRSSRLQASRGSIVQELGHAGNWFRRRPA